jgi:probable rRNA maturation factor
MIRVAITDRQSCMRLDRRHLRRAVRRVLRDEAIVDADVSLAIVDDAAIRQLHRRYLAQDEPTDVLSFLLESSPEGLEGEIVVSAETARRVARQYKWTAAEELLLYVVHGALHLAGWTDDTPKTRAAMEDRQRGYVARLAEGVRSEVKNAKCKMQNAKCKR